MAVLDFNFALLIKMEEITGAFVNDVDAWIERLYTCKPLSEAEVKLLCEKVIL